MNEVRIIIAGSRTFSDYSLLNKKVTDIICDNKYKLNTIRIISGTASGADTLGERYAQQHNLKLTQMPADWSQGKKAGYIRNTQMAEFAIHNDNDGILIAFWDGKSHGTKNIIDIAKEYNMNVYVIKYKDNNIANTNQEKERNQMNHDLFKNELKTIKNDDIREFAEKVLDDAPNYFFHVAASSTGKYHPQYALGDGGLMRHTKAVIRFYNHIMSIEQNSALFTEREIDLGRVACLAHDIQKSGNSEYYEEKSNDGKNKVFTVFNHPLLAAKYILNYKDKYLTEKELKFIALAIGSHMGQWNTDKRNPDIVLPKPKTEMQKIVHLSDYLASRKDIDVLFNDDDSAYTIPDVNEYKMPFGKYTNKLITEVPKDYLKWLASKDDLREPLKTFIPQLLVEN